MASKRHSQTELVALWEKVDWEIKDRVKAVFHNYDGWEDFKNEWTMRCGSLKKRSGR